MAELVAINSVWPSGAAFATAFTPTCWPAPGRFSTTNGLPIRCSQTCAAMRASRSVEPAGVNGTTTMTVLDGQSCADAEMIAANKTRKGHSSHRGVMGMPPVDPETSMRRSSRPRQGGQRSRYRQRSAWKCARRSGWCAQPPRHRRRRSAAPARSRPRWPAPLVEPGAVFTHLLALRRRRVALAGRGLVALGRRAPAQLDAVVRVVRHLESHRTVDYVTQGERPRGAVTARIRELARRQLGREHALQFGFHLRDALVLRHRVALGPPRDPIRIAEHHVDCNQQPQVARRRREVFPRTARLEDRRAVRHGRFATLAVLELASVLDRGHAHFHLLFVRRDRLLRRSRRIEWGGRHHIVHAVVEVLDAEPRLIEREIGVLRVLPDLGVVQPPHRAVDDHHRTEALKSRTADRGPAQTGSCRARSVTGAILSEQNAWFVPDPWHLFAPLS